MCTCANTNQETKGEKRDALLSLSRKTLLYTMMSMVLNLIIHLPRIRILPYDAMVRT